MPEKLLYQDFSYNQSTTQHVIQTYPRLRDFYNQPGRKFPLIILANEIAKCANLSLYSVKETFKSSAQEHIFPTLINVLSNIQAETSTLLYAWNFFRNSTHQTFELPHFLEINSYPLNLVYCDNPEFEKESIFDFTVFTNCFDITTWIFIVLSILAITFLINQSTGNLSTSCTVAFNSLVSSVIGFPSISKIKLRCQAALLINLWLFSSTVIVNLYLGIMSSNIVKPSSLKIIASYFELNKKGFNLVYNSNADLDFLKALSIYRNLTTLQDMLSKANVISDNNNYINDIVFGKKTATVAAWTRVSLVASTANQIAYAHARNMVGLTKPENECFIGKKLIPSGMLFYGLLPPKHLKVLEVLKWFIDTGINDRWVNEYIGLTKARRVQDRVKHISRTKILAKGEKASERNVSPLGMRGKIKRSFSLCVICLAACVVVFLVEVFYSRWLGNHG